MAITKLISNPCNSDDALRNLCNYIVNPVPMEAGNNRKLEMNYSFMTELSQEIEKIIAAYI